MGGRSFFHFLVKWGGHYKMLWGVKNFKNCKVTPPTIKHKRVIDVSNEFVDAKPNRKSIFGKFVEEDS